MTSIVFLNGQYLAESDAHISIYDRGFLFGDGVYEVIPFYQGQGFRLQEHLDRLQRSLDAVGIVCDIPWKTVCQALVGRNSGEHQAVYLHVTRGADRCRRHQVVTSLEPTCLAFSYPIHMALSAPLDQVQGISAITTADLRWSRCDIKATTLLPNIMALQEAFNQGAQEALMVRDGLLTEGSACNLFVISDGVIRTPRRGPWILGGTTRDLVQQLAQEAAIDWVEEDVPLERARQCDEIWISSSTRGVIPVLMLDEQVVGDGKPGPVWRRVAEGFVNFEQRCLRGDSAHEEVSK